MTRQYEKRMQEAAEYFKKDFDELGWTIAEKKYLDELGVTIKDNKFFLVLETKWRWQKTRDYRLIVELNPPSMLHGLDVLEDKLEAYYRKAFSVLQKKQEKENG